jgi:hypothetical protein
MPGRKPHEAYEAFIAPIRAAVAVLGTAHVTVGGRRFDPGSDHAWALNRAQGMDVGPLRLRADMRFTFREDPDLGATPWRVSTLGYRYTIEDRGSGHELVAWHWHPDGGRSPQPDPHLHLGHELLTTDAALQGRHHLPSGRVAFEQVVQSLIEDFKVTPTRDDWKKTLQDSEHRFRSHATWSRVATPVQRRGDP